MFIVWSGWGFLVAVFFVVGCFVGFPVGSMVSKDPNVSMAVAVIVGGLIAGLGSFLLAKKIESGQGRAYIDEATQQRIVVKPHAGSLFFVPTRYWAYVAPVLAIALGALVMATPPADQAVAETIVDPAADLAPIDPAAPLPAPTATSVN